MDPITSGLTAVFNGAAATAGALASWHTLFGVLTAASLVWLARLEIDDVDRRGAKPQVARH